MWERYSTEKFVYTNSTLNGFVVTFICRLLAEFALDSKSKNFIKVPNMVIILLES
jgi:hypothetical protein